MFPEGSTSLFANKLNIVLISIAFSIITYFLVEKPLRFRKTKYVLYLLVLCMICIAAFSIINK
jgi:hypothetical protein